MEEQTPSEKLASLESKFPENYQVESFLGEGSFGQVVQCFKKDTKETVAVKIPAPGSSLMNEFTTLSIFKCVHLDKYNIIKFIEAFMLKDNRVALACEKLDVTLIDYIINHRGFAPLDLREVRSIIQQMAVALNALKSRGIIHSDIKGNNIMLVDCEAKPIRVKLIDFGLAFPIYKAKRGMLYQTEMYRAPEINLGLPFSEAIDMWSLGIIMSSMMLGYSINQGRSRYSKIRRLVDLLGMPPDHLLNDGWHTKRYFIKTSSGNWRLKTPAEYWGDHEHEEDLCYPFRSLDELETLSLPNLDAVRAEEKKECIDLLKAMLRLDPTQRITPAEVLNHPFIRRGGVQHSSDNEQPGTSKTEEPLPTEMEDQGTNKPEEPGANETEDQGTNKPEEPGANETEDQGTNKPEEPGANETEDQGTNKPEEPGANETEDQGTNKPEEPGANETEDQGTNKPEEPGANKTENQGTNKPEEPGANETEDQGTNQADESKDTYSMYDTYGSVLPDVKLARSPELDHSLEPAEFDTCSSDSCGFYGLKSKPSPRATLVQPAPPDRCYNLEEEEQIKSCSSDSRGSTKTSSLRVILVKPAPPDRCHNEDDEEQSEYCSVTTLEDSSENSSAEYPRKDEGCCPVSLFFAKGCNSELTATTADDTDTEKKRTRKKKKKNCVKRFFRWIKKTFCSCVSAKDDED